MKWSNNKLHRVSIFLSLLLILSSSQILSAQENISDMLRKMGYSANEIESVANGSPVTLKSEPEGIIKVSYTGRVFQMTLPNTSSGKYLYLAARGGDGDESKYPGGQGASLSAGFKVGDDGIPIGSTLRFIVGQGNGGDGTGGGGTGILYKGPNDQSWTPLLVAGGGGGGGEDYSGEAGMLETSGGIGGGSGGSDGKDHGIGLGANSSYDDNGTPIGSRMATWGFGGGGNRTSSKCAPSNLFDQGRTFAGGGGGGYSGGGGGNRCDGQGGGGGGSYVAPNAIDIISKRNGTTKDKDIINGYIHFRFNHPPFNLGEKKVSSIRPSFHLDKCIDNYAGITDNHNKIQIWTCGSSNNNQKWFFYDNTIRLSNNRDKCLQLPSTNNGTKLELYQCSGSTAQKWSFDPFNSMIRSKKDLNKCIDLENGNTANGTYIQIKDCQMDNPDMQWTLEEAEPNPLDEIFGQMSLSSNTDLCLDLKNTNVSNGANIQLWECSGNAAQTWFVNDKKIKLASNSFYCLAINGGNHTDVHIWDCKDQDNEEWIFDVPYQFIRSREDPTKCLSRVDIGSLKDIKVVNCAYGNGKTNQQWILPGGYSEILDGDNKKIHLAKDDNMCVDMYRNASGGNLRVYECQDDGSQGFFFDGSRIKRADNTSLCVTLENGNTTNGSNIELATCQGSTASQKWMYDGMSGRIHSKVDPNKCMRFSNGNASNGTNIKISDCDEDQAEIFVIK